MLVFLVLILKDFKFNFLKNIQRQKNKKLSFIFRSVFIVFSFSLFNGCKFKDKENIVDVCTKVEIPCISEKVNIVFITNKGEIEFELNGEVAPITVGNFVDLIERGSYNYTYFHKVIFNKTPKLRKQILFYRRFYTCT